MYRADVVTSDIGIRLKAAEDEFGSDTQ